MAVQLRGAGESCVSVGVHRAQSAVCPPCTGSLEPLQCQQSERLARLIYLPAAVSGSWSGAPPPAFPPPPSPPLRRSSSARLRTADRRGIYAANLKEWSLLVPFTHLPSPRVSTSCSGYPSMPLQLQLPCLVFFCSPVFLYLRFSLFVSG